MKQIKADTDKDSNKELEVLSDTRGLCGEPQQNQSNEPY